MLPLVLRFLFICYPCAEFNVVSQFLHHLTGSCQLVRRKTVYALSVPQLQCNLAHTPVHLQIGVRSWFGKMVQSGVEQTCG